MKKILLLFIGLLFWAGSSWGQVSTYTFASSMGTYTPITGGTFLISGTSTMDSWASTVQTIPSFNLNGVAYTKAYVTSNGILTLGGTAPSSSATTGISTNVGSGIAICPFSGDLDRATTTASTEIRWETIENEVIFQWQQVKRYGSTNVESFDMQARLNTTNGVIIFIYKINTGPGNSTSYFPQVGIRTSATDYTNRLVASGTEDWATSLSGTANTNTCRFTSVSPAKGFTSGLTFTYTPPVVTTPPNCAAIISPTDGTTNVQASATLNWASGGGTPTGYKLYFGAGSLPGTFTDLGNVTTFDPSPDLSYSTTYYWKVVPYNDNGDAIGCSVWSFTTMADPTILTFPYEQKFESTEFPPNGWEEVRTPSSSYGWISNSSGYTGKCARFDSFNNTTGNISNLITPPIDLTSLTLARLIFKFKNPTGGDFSVLLSTDGGLTYPNVIWTGLTGQTAWLEKTADITAYIGTNIKIAFKGKSNYGSGDAYIYLDDITIEEIPSTPIFSINPTSKDFGTVVASGAPTAAQTFTIKNTGAGALIITSNGISITGADADQFTLSAVSYPINLTTGQSTTVDVAFAPATAGSKTAELNVVHNAAGSPSTAVLTGAALPAGSLVESFEGETFPPTDWKVINSGDANTWYRNELNAHSGVACASIKYSSEAHNDWLITPMLQPLAGNSTLSFWAKNYLDSYIERFNVKLSTTGNNESDFTIDLALNVGPGANYTQYSYDLSAYNGLYVYVAVQAISKDKYYLYLDDFIGPKVFVPSCPAPTALTVSNITLSSADLGWTENGTATTWNIKWGTPGFDPETEGTLISDITTKPHTLSGLTTITAYNWYVQAACGVGDESNWAGPKTFTTNNGKAINPIPTSGALDIAVASTTLNWDDVVGATSYTISIGTTPGGNDIANAAACAISEFIHSSNWNSSTTYFWTVSTVYSGGTIVGNPWSFTTECEAYNIPYSESFETNTVDGNTIANCWVQQSLAGDQTWVAHKSSVAGNTYNRTPRTGDWNATLRFSNTDWMFQSFSQVGGTSYTFDMYARQDAGSGASITVSYGDAANAASMTNEIVALTNVIAGEYQLISGTFTPASTGVYVIGILGTLNGTPWHISIDDISIYMTPTCPSPTALTVSNITVSSADMDWTESGTATTWNIKWGTPGFDPETEGTLIPDITTKPHTLSGLTANTDYNCYVQAACGVGDESNWAGPKTFSTLCGVESIPYFENFDGVTAPAIPNCMSVIDVNADSETWETTNGGLSQPNAAVISYNTSLAMNDWLFTAGLQLTAGKTYAVSFAYAAASTTSYSENLAVDWGTEASPTAMSGTPIFDKANILGGWYAGNGSFTPTTSGIYYVGFHGYSPADMNALYIDDISVLEVVATASWTGAIDMDWFTAGNWDTNIPTSGTDVTIPADRINYPTITNLANCNNITLQSNATGTASLLGNNLLVVSGTAAVERYISGAPEAWHLLSSPVKVQSISDDFTPSGSYLDGTGYDFYAWDETDANWLNKKIGENGITNFIPGKGYLVAYQLPNTKIFTGILNNGNVIFALKNGGTGDYKGSNLLGNPYPSSIDWKSAGLDKSKLVNNGGHSMYIYNQTDNNYGVYNDVNSGDGGTNGVSRYIAPMQGFFVMAASADNFSFDNAARVHTPQAWLKSGNNNTFSLSVTAPANAGKDEILLDFGHEASLGGADKWYSMSATAPALYVPTVERDYSIRFLTNTADNQIVPVAFKAGLDGEYSIQANFSTAAFSVKLMDQLTGNVQDLNTNQKYDFTATTGDNADRFNLVFGTLGINNPVAAEAIQVYAYGDVLYLETASKESALVSVYNLTGQLVMQGKTGGNALSTFNASALSNGVYVVNVIHSQGVVSQKVVIRK